MELSKAYKIHDAVNKISKHDAQIEHLVNAINKQETLELGELRMMGSKTLFVINIEEHQIKEILELFYNYLKKSKAEIIAEIENLR